MESVQQPKDDKPALVSTTVQLDPELRKRVKIHAIERGETFTAVLHRFLHDGLVREAQAA